MKYIDADKLISEIEKRKDIHRKNYEEFKDERFINDECEDDNILSLITSLQQEPPINTELCTLIACDVIQATAKKAIEKPQDKDKEEDLMIKKMEYLNMLEKSLFQQEQLAQKEQMLKDNPVIMPVEDFQALIDSHAKRVEADYKEKMLKEAVECDVIVPIYEGNNVWSAEIKIPGRYELSDKVRVIVIKEDK